MLFQKATHCLLLAAALTVGLRAPYAAACDFPIPTPLAGNNCTVQSSKATGVAVEAGSTGRTKYRYKVKLTVGGLAIAHPLKADGTATLRKDGAICPLAGDESPVDSAFGEEITCELKIAGTAVTYRIAVS